ncbi:protein mono-ADP-ribosyltransferase PARP3-like [Clytia hemisphaerica]|uniref:Poly [ADP-ribose] polymerase n=1 Tax=Clytia hemisphaerica TaxID=252671 RepID=A0A7M5X2H1_9CNID|eukprot:TCONS_00007410-protein
MSKRKATTNLASTASTVDFKKLTVPLLKQECQQRQLEITGKKAELIKRLQDYESGAVIKKEEEDVDDETEQKELTMKEKLKKLAEEEKKNQKGPKRFKVDTECPYYHGAQIVDDYDCMLNQTNIGANNNKFYIIQLFSIGTNYWVWTRWGRVGDSGQNALKGPTSLDAAKKEFEKKFRDKTKNKWEDRANFKPASGKYTMIEIDTGADSQDIAEMENKLTTLDDVDGPSSSKKSKQTSPCTLDKETQDLIKLIFDNDMFKEAMANFDIDVKKMPLGKLSKAQIAKGFEVLEELEEVIKKNARNTTAMNNLTSKFFTLIPHNFGRKRPPTINGLEILQKKMEMLMVLGDIEVAQSLQKGPVKTENGDVPHPLDANYGLLNCGLTLVDKKSETYKIIDTYVQNTKYGSTLLEVWEVDRDGEDKRFDEHKDIEHRKLLWHGTNVAVVVAILKSGLRIMPHSGGRVGRGIYFASEHSKSAAYVGSSRDGTGIMFLNEVALGKQHIIHQDDSSLRAAPKGSDSVLAQGCREPDPSKEVTIQMDGNDVIVPQGKPISNDLDYTSFHQSEYLVYKESQCRIRYLLKFKMH